MSFLVFNIEALGRGSPVPQPLQRMKVFEFDTTKFPFKEAIAEILNVRPDSLETLQHTEDGKKALEEGLCQSFQHIVIIMPRDERGPAPEERSAAALHQEVYPGGPDRGARQI